MKILVLCRSMPWHLAGGLENHTWDLARGLAAAGDEAHVLTTPAKAEAGRPPSAPPRLTVHELPAGPPGRYSIGVFRAFAREAQRLDREIGFDAIHSQGYAAFLFPARMAGRLAVTIHGTLYSETALHGPHFHALSLRDRLRALWRFKRRPLAAPLYARLLRQARRIIVDSQFTRGELLRGRPALADRIRVAPLAIHPERAPSAPANKPLPSPPIRMLSVGRLTEAKGMHVALEALAMLPPDGWRWTVAGDGPERERLIARAAALGLTGRIEFLGRVDDIRMDALYARHDLFIYPELAFPAFGLVGLEALLAGLPVVASDRGAIPEVVQPDCGWLFPGGDSGALARRLKDLIEHPALIHQFAQHTRSRALERFAYTQMIEKTRAALLECAG